MRTLVLRQRQIDGMARESQTDFTRRLLAHLRKVFPGETREVFEPDLLAQIELHIVKARNYGIEMESDVVRYVDLTVMLGADFDVSPRIPWASSILNDKVLTGAQKAEFLWNHLSEELDRATELGRQSRKT